MNAIWIVVLALNLFTLTACVFLVIQATRFYREQKRLHKAMKENT